MPVAEAIERFDLVAHPGEERADLRPGLGAVRADEAVLGADAQRRPERRDQPAMVEIALDQRDPAERHAALFQRHVDRVVGIAEAGAMRPVARHLGHAAPGGPVRRRVEKPDALVVQQRQPGERPGLGDPRGQRRCADRRRPVVGQHRAVEPVIRSRAEADCGVHPVAIEIHDAQAGDEAELDLGMRLGKAEKARRQPFRREGRSRRDGQAVVVAEPRDRANRLAQTVEALGHARLQGTARLGQLDGAVQATEQRAAEMLLELLDLVAERRRGDEQLLGGLAEAHVPGGRLKGAKRGQRRQALAHPRLNPVEPIGRKTRLRAPAYKHILPVSKRSVGLPVQRS